MLETNLPLLSLNLLFCHDDGDGFVDVVVVVAAGGAVDSVAVIVCVDVAAGIAVVIAAVASTAVASFQQLRIKNQAKLQEKKL